MGRLGSKNVVHCLARTEMWLLCISNLLFFCYLVVLNLFAMSVDIFNFQCLIVFFTQ